MDLQLEKDVPTIQYWKKGGPTTEWWKKFNLQLCNGKRWTDDWVMEERWTYDWVKQKRLTHDRVMGKDGPTTEWSRKTNPFLTDGGRWTYDLRVMEKDCPKTESWRKKYMWFSNVKEKSEWFSKPIQLCRSHKGDSDGWKKWIYDGVMKKIEHTDWVIEKFKYACRLSDGKRWTSDRDGLKKMERALVSARQLKIKLE